MLRATYLVMLSLILSACSSLDGMSKEEELARKEKLDRNASILVNTAVTPILNLIDASIIYYEDKGEWPIFSGVPGESSHFTDYKVTSASKEKLTSEFRLKSMNFDWILELESTGTEEEGRPLYLVNLNGSGGHVGFTSGITGLKTVKGISAADEKKKKSLAVMLSIMVDVDTLLAKDISAKSSPVIETATGLVVGAVICSVFGVPLEQCRLDLGVQMPSDEEPNVLLDKRRKIEMDMKRKLEEMMHKKG